MTKSKLNENFLPRVSVMLCPLQLLLVAKQLPSICVALLLMETPKERGERNKMKKSAGAWLLDCSPNLSQLRHNTTNQRFNQHMFLQFWSLKFTWYQHGQFLVRLLFCVLQVAAILLCAPVTYSLWVRREGREQKRERENKGKKKYRLENPLLPLIGTHPFRAGPILKTSFNFSDFLRGPNSKYSYTGSYNKDV